ncbi:MAG: beta-ketoacyl-ACP synthase III [Bacillota bacterium]|nr:beta-ketoacyl-ACP synthase III [Bacillota bacterium]
MSIKLISTGSFVSDHVMTNDDLSKMVDTTNDWIVERTGIETRHISKDLTTEEMAYRACKNALDRIDIRPEEIGLLICSTISQDSTVPSSSFTVSGKLGLTDLVCFDLNAACTGFIYAVSVAKSMMETMNIKYAVVAGAERLSKFVDWTDRGSCILFGDAAGAAVLKNTKLCAPCEDVAETALGPGEYDLELLEVMLGGTYDQKKYLSMQSKDSPEDDSPGYINMNGRQIYKFATSIGVKIIDELLEKSGVDREDVVLLVPHQANSRIIDTLSEKSSIPKSKWFMNLNKYGNTSSASVPVALNEAIPNFDLEAHRGKYILSLAFGGGLSYGGILIKIN